MNNLTLIIPAKNEAESLPKVLTDLNNIGCKIIISLKSQDVETINAVKKFNLKIHRQTKKGYGNSLTEAIKICETEFFCIFNADGSFNPIELKNMYDLAIKGNADFIFASRYMDGGLSQDDTITTFIGNKMFTFIGQFFFSLPISDILYTFVLGNTQKANNLQLKEKSFSLCAELPILAKKFKHKIISVPSHERARIAGKKKVNEFKDGFLILVSMIKLYFLRN